jgi:hypothetical protein
MILVYRTTPRFIEGPMPYELRPRGETIHSAQEVAELLTGEFRYVKGDADDGLRQAQARAEWIERAPARIFLGHHERALQGAARLKSLVPGEALTIEFGDNAETVLRAIVLPGETISFGFRSNEEQLASKSLAERCARALDCELVVV